MLVLIVFAGFYLVKENTVFQTASIISTSDCSVSEGDFNVGDVWCHVQHLTDCRVTPCVPLDNHSVFECIVNDNRLGILKVFPNGYAVWNRGYCKDYVEICQSGVCVPKPECVVDSDCLKDTCSVDYSCSNFKCVFTLKSLPVSPCNGAVWNESTCSWNLNACVQSECLVNFDCEGKVHVDCVGSWECNGGICDWVCQSAVCGDGLCNFGEDSGSCLSDCPLPPVVEKSFVQQFIEWFVALLRSFGLNV